MKIILITLIFSFVVAEACVCPVSYDEYTNAVIKNLQEQQESTVKNRCEGFRKTCHRCSIPPVARNKSIVKKSCIIVWLNYK